MRTRLTSVLMAALLSGSAAFASGHEDADVVILGEYHDNPAHHAHQLDWITRVAPRAVVFEMLTPEEAAELADVPRQPAAMAEAIAGFEWTNLSDYVALLAASPVILGAAVPRETVRAAFRDGAAAHFGAEAALFGLTQALPEDQLETRKALQFEAHCHAMPRDLMGGMVEAQRLRDAAFARAVLQALGAHGSPVVLITGNGHARKDWGVPAVLAQVQPDLKVFVIGQTERSAALAGGYDLVLDAEPPLRQGACEAFK